MQPSETGLDAGATGNHTRDEADPIRRLRLAANLWDELVELGRRGETDEYQPLGGRIGQPFALALRFPLDRIYWYCEARGLPALSVLAINKETRLPGSGFGRISRERFQEICAEVFDFDWRTVPNPYAFAAVRVGGTDPVSRILQVPDEAEEVYRSVKDRGRGQLLFREAVMEAYGGRCAVTGSKIRTGLEAAHIVPWSVAPARIRLDVRNGILLTAWHHRLFDAGVITLGEDYRLRVRLDAGASEFDLEALSKLAGHRVRVPRRRDHRPDPALIRQRGELLNHTITPER
jgi:putative restriction endonuclease